MDSVKVPVSPTLTSQIGRHRPNSLAFSPTYSKLVADISKHSFITVNRVNYYLEDKDLEIINDDKKGNYGVVSRVRHKETGTVMSLKRITMPLKPTDVDRFISELTRARRARGCEHLVDFYGAMFRDGEIWSFTEDLSLCTSLDTLFKAAFKNGIRFSEHILSKIAFNVVKALEYLHSELQIIHKNVQPRNILISKTGNIKLGHFLTASETHCREDNENIRIYMAPERINPQCSITASKCSIDQLLPQGDASIHHVKSDVWSVGITMMEVATGTFPYITSTPFHQLCQIVNDPEPRIQSGTFSECFLTFISLCVEKDVNTRSDYADLLNQNFFTNYRNITEEQVAKFFIDILKYV